MGFHKDIDMLISTLRDDANNAKEAGDIRYATGMNCARVLIEETLQKHGYKKPVVVDSKPETLVQSKE